VKVAPVPRLNFKGNSGRSVLIRARAHRALPPFK
jgi:hypothetical protein